ncbi:MAG: hypothetical protein LBE91_10320 [Tannerella sp.]|jgi:transposase-like protein|nr:hypothetical protein [Tannerella sp.]
MEAIDCKKCSSGKFVKNGKVRYQQRYKCKECGYNFVIGDKREKLSPAARALAVLLYRGKASYGFIAKLFKISPVSVMKLIRHEMGNIPESETESSIKEASFDEICRFIGQKKIDYGTDGQWSAVEIGQSDGVLGLVLLRHPGTAAKSNRRKNRQ